VGASRSASSPSCVAATARLTFDRSAPPTTRNAIALLRLHGAPATLIDSALACAAELDRQRGATLIAR